VVIVVHVIVLIWERRVTAVPGGGGRSEWERHMAAQRREAERQAKEQARLAREREKAAPDWADFAPADPKGLARIFGGNARHAREVAEAQVRFDAAVKAHAQAEAARQRALANAKAAYDLEVVADQKRVADVRARQSAFMAGDPEAVEWFVSRVLDASRYPRGFPRRYQVAYRPENRWWRLWRRSPEARGKVSSVRAGAGVRVHRRGSGWYWPPTRELCWLCIADAI